MTIKGEMCGAHGGRLRWEFPVKSDEPGVVAEGVRFADDERGLYGFVPLARLTEEYDTAVDMRYFRDMVEYAIDTHYLVGKGYRPAATW